MANLVSDGNRDILDATWQAVDGTSLNVSTSSGGTALTTGNLDSTAFTPGAITVEGICVKLLARAAGSPTNTITIILRNTTGGVDVKTVVANVSDLPAAITGADSEGGWHYFKFDAAVLLLAATNYVVRATLSATSTAVTLATNGTPNNWQRILVLSTTATPAAGDDLHVPQILDGATSPATPTAQTVTIGQTATTDYGSANTNENISALQVSKGSIVQFLTTAATQFILRLSGHLNVFSGGTLSIGTSGTPMPRGSSAELQFDCVSDGDFGLQCRNGAIVNFHGLSRTAGNDSWTCRLSADEAAGQTTLSVDTDTGWLSGDEIAIASTTRIATQHERRTLNGAAGATTIDITAGLTNAHSGSGDYFAEIILLTRNVRMTSVSATGMSVINVRSAAVVTWSWASIRRTSSATDIFTVETNSSGSLSATDCCFFDMEVGINFDAPTGDGGNWTLRRCAFYNQTVSATTNMIAIQPTTAVTWVLEDIIIIGMTSSSTTAAAINFLDLGGTIGNLSVNSLACNGLILSGEVPDGALYPTITGTVWRVHSMSQYGISIEDPIDTLTFPRLEVWRCAGGGMALALNTGLADVVFDGGYFIANGGVANPTGFLAREGNQLANVIFRDIDFAGDTSNTTNYGVLFDHARIVAARIRFENCRFSQTSGLRVPVTVADIGVISNVEPGKIYVEAFCQFCTFGAPLAVSYFNAVASSIVRCEEYNQTVGDHRAFTPRGNLIVETTTTVSGIGLRMQPIGGLAVPLDSNGLVPGQGFMVPILAGQTAGITVQVQIDASYNGSTDPQLVVLANNQLGIAADTVLDTHSGATGAFETLAGTTPVAAGDGVFECVVRAYGTAGLAFVDDWTAA